MVPFRTCEYITEQASEKLTELFSFHIRRDGALRICSGNSQSGGACEELSFVTTLGATFTGR